MTHTTDTNEETRLLRLPSTLGLPRKLEEFKNVDSMGDSIVPLARAFAAAVHYKLSGACKNNGIAVKTEMTFIEGTGDIANIISFPLAHPVISVKGKPEEVEKLYNLLPDIMKEHPPTREYQEGMDILRSLNITDVPDNVWQLFFPKTSATPGKVYACEMF